MHLSCTRREHSGNQTTLEPGSIFLAKPMDTSGKLREFTIGCTPRRLHQLHAQCASATNICKRQASFSKRSRWSLVTDDAVDAVIAYAAQIPHARTRRIAGKQHLEKQCVESPVWEHVPPLHEDL